MDTELVGQPHPEGSGQQLGVPMDTSDNWCPSEVSIGTVLFHIFTNYDKRMECTLSKFAEDNKLTHIWVTRLKDGIHPEGFGQA